jgi:hypothetical protein
VLFGIVHLGLPRAAGWTAVLFAALSGLLLGLGLVLVSTIFDLLARRGHRFGKFLIHGPLVGGLYFAVTPLGEYFALGPNGALRTLLFHVFLGILIGNGVAFGVELAELLLASGPSAARS